jgi:hypothetical protein
MFRAKALGSPLLSYLALTALAPLPGEAALSFVKGVNLNGQAVTIEGNTLLSQAAAEEQGLKVSNAWGGSASYSFGLTPSPEAGVASMLQSVYWRGSVATGQGFALAWTIPNGSYQVYFWTLENYRSNYRSFDIRMEGMPTASAIGDLTLGEWRKYGPYSVTVADGMLNVDVLRGAKGDPCLAGMAIYSDSPGAAPPTGSVFVRGINLNGSAVTIKGRQWLSYTAALQSGFSVSPVFTATGVLKAEPNPPTDAATRGMLDSLLWCSAAQSQRIDMTQQIANGTYQVSVWLVENYIANYRAMDLKLEGVTVATGIGNLPLGGWKEYGPYTTAVSDGVLNISVLRGAKGDPSIAGLAIYSVPTPASLPISNQPPQVIVTAPGDNASYLANASISVSANAVDSDGKVVKVEFFVNGGLAWTSTAAPYMFAWNNVEVGKYSILARAADDNGVMASSATINITVNAPPLSNGVRVSDFGAVGNGSVDDRAAIQHAIDSSPPGVTVDFGSGRTYLIGSSVTLAPNRVYSGASTIKLAGYAPAWSTIFSAGYGASDNITISGLTLDASGVGVHLRLNWGGGVNAPAKNVRIRGCTFVKGKLAGPGNTTDNSSALYFPAGLANSEIVGNRFHSCDTCIFVTNPNWVAIESNDFDTVTGGNAISVVNFDRPFEFGNGLTIRNNTGRNFWRMAIELFGASSWILNEPVIEGNVFTDWNPNTTSQDPFGISIVMGQGAKIRNNVISGLRTYGIEAGAPGMLIQGNTITGFTYGVVLQGNRDITVDNNSFHNQQIAAVWFSNANPATGNVRAAVTNNTMTNPKLYGVGMDPNNFASLNLSGNRINRQAGFWEGDATRVFIGVKIDDGARAAFTVQGNTIMQTAASVPAGFSFRALGLYGRYPGSVYSGNTMESKSSSPFGHGMFLWSQGLLDELTVSKNQFTGLSNVTNGLTSSRVRAVDNAACRVNTLDFNVVWTTYCPFKLQTEKPAEPTADGGARLRRVLPVVHGDEHVERVLNVTALTKNPATR